MVDETAAPSASRRRLLVAGGGTAGHIFPALAVADLLATRGWELAWAGRAASLEARLVSAHGVRFHAVASRPVVGRGPVGRLAALGTLLGSSLRASRLVRRARIGVVLGTGGYVSVPAVVGARLAGRPALLLEPNARAGAANRWLSRWAQAAAVAYEESIGELRCPAVLTGVPVRREFFAGTHEPPPSPPLRVLVLGGSQGAEQLNRLLPPALAALPPELPRLRVLHQVGPRHLEAAERAYDLHGPRGIEVELAPFLEDVAGAMRESHLVISRAGAVTLAEICAARLPALLIPLAIAGAHQVDNARRVAASGGARVLTGEEATAERLSAELSLLLGDAEVLATMRRSLAGLARPAAAEAIADLVEQMVEAA